MQLSISNQGKAAPRASGRKLLLRKIFYLPTVAWLLLWASINTGPWEIRHLFSGGMGVVNGLRAVGPVVIFILGLFLLLARNKETPATAMTWPEKFFCLYGFAMLLSSIQVSPWFDAAYWAFAFIATLLVVRSFLGGSALLANIVWLNILTWAITSIVLVVLLFVAREALFGAETGYGVVNRVGDLSIGPMSRSTGLARFASIPAIIAFVLLWRMQSVWQWVLTASVFLISIWLVWFMQSRGAIFSLAFALGFVMLFKGRWPRVMGIFLVVISILVGAGGIVSQDTINYIWDHITRGTGAEGFRDMSGRDLIWQHAWEAIKEQPIIGYGPQADRRIIFANAQNGVIYAMLCAGGMGLIGYVGGMISAWWYFIKIKMRFKLSSFESDFTMMCAGILAFFTLRSYPENAAALFSIDLLVQYPVMVFFPVMYKHLLLRTKVRYIGCAHPSISQNHGAPVLYST